MRTGAAGGGGFFGKRGFFWKLLASGLMPIIMASAYAFMAATSESDNTGKAWMALGFFFVLVLWWVFRVTTSSAALARAVAVGDSERILELVPAKARSAQACSHRALAYAMAGTWDAAIAEASLVQARAGATAELRGEAAAIRIGAHVELAQIAEARALFAAELARYVDARTMPPPHHELARQARLALGRVAWAEGDLDAATAELDRVMHDVRSGAAARALAHTYAGRIATTRGDRAAAAKHHAEVIRLAPASWMAR